MISLFPVMLIFIACFLFAITRPKVAIFLPLILSSAYLVKIDIFGLPSTFLEVILIAVLLGVWLELFLRRRSWAIFSGLKTKNKDELKRQNSPVCGRDSFNVLIRSCSRSTVLLVGVFVLSATISAFIAPHPHVAWGYWKALIIEPVIFAITLAAIVNKEARAKNLIKALLLGGLVSVVLSLFTMGFGVDFGRFRGIYDVPNSLALIVAPLCTMGLMGIILSVKNQSTYLVACIIFGGVLIATQSMAGLAAVVFVVTAGSIIIKKGWRVMLVLCLVVLVGVGMQVATGKFAHLFDKQSSSLIAREQIWFISSRMILENPLLGSGLGTFEPAYQQSLKKYLENPGLKKFEPLEWVVRDPHNILLSFWLNVGMFGMVAMILLVVRSMGKLFGLLFGVKNSEVSEQKKHQILLGAALFTLVLFGLFDVPFWKNDLSLVWMVLLI